MCDARGDSYGCFVSSKRKMLTLSYTILRNFCAGSFFKSESGGTLVFAHDMPSCQGPYSDYKVGGTLWACGWVGGREDKTVL